MNYVNSVNILDGNSYIVKSADNSLSSGADFDRIYEKQCVQAGMDDIFEEAAHKYGVDVRILKAVGFVESNFRSNAVSKSGAMGVMQLMPYTAKSYGVDDPFDAEQNINGGAKLLAELLEKYDGNVSLSVAAYNAGSGAVDKYGGVPPYDQTVRYVEKINDALGGALDNDSWKIEGSKPTYMGGAAITKSSNTGSNTPQSIYSQSKSSTGFMVYNSGIILKSGLDGEDAEDISSLSGKIAGSEDTASENSKLFEVEDADKEEGVHMDTDTDKNTATDVVAAADDMTIINAAQTIDSIIKNSSISMYEAQASVISPLVVQMRDI